MILQLNEINSVLGLPLLSNNEDAFSFTPAFDSRIMGSGTHTLFFAFGTKGLQACNEAYNKGCRHFICEENPLLPASDSHVFIVENTLVALQKLASYVRSKYQNPLIGITGSNGKTIVKEWISQFLAPQFIVTKNPGSYNSQIGVPLSLLLLQENTQIGVFEAGISKPKEMVALAQLMQPTIGVFTFLGVAHEENFENAKQILIEKSTLFESCQQIIVEADSLAETHFKNRFPHKEIIRINTSNKNVDYALIKNGELFTWFEKGKELGSFSFHRNDKASILNLLLAMAAARNSGADLQHIFRIIPLLSVPIGRLRLQNGVHNSKIVNDSYVADIASLKIALEELNQIPNIYSKTLILSDFPAQKDQDKLYKDIVNLCNQYNPSKVLLIGSEISKYATQFNGFSSSFLKTEDALQELNTDSFSNEAILIKGSRAFELEKIAAILEEQNHECFLEINLDAISKNVKAFKAKLSPECKLMVMVKAFSYGTGSVEMGRHLEYIGADYLAVAYADEGVQLRKAGIQLPIMVMSPETPSINAIKTYNLEPEVYSFRTLDLILQELENASVNQNITIHIKIDTGMHRLGFMPNEIEKLANKLKSHPNIKIASIFTHLVGADDPDLDSFSAEQIARFKKASNSIIEAIGYKPYLHFQNSSGITRLYDNEVSMARLGIGMYGYSSDASMKEELQVALTFKTVISAIREISEPETVGYNRRGKVKGNMKIATISVGYADGFSRRLGLGNYQVKIGEYLAETIGSICMDMCMINVTDIPCKEGDEVILFGPNHQIELMAETCGTIPYEILTGIGQRVKRIYLKE